MLDSFLLLRLLILSQLWLRVGLTLTSCGHYCHPHITCLDLQEINFRVLLYLGLGLASPSWRELGCLDLYRRCWPRCLLWGIWFWFDWSWLLHIFFYQNRDFWLRLWSGLGMRFGMRCRFGDCRWLWSTGRPNRACSYITGLLLEYDHLFTLLHLISDLSQLGFHCKLLRNQVLQLMLQIFLITEDIPYVLVLKNLALQFFDILDYYWRLLFFVFRHGHQQKLIYCIYAFLDGAFVLEKVLDQLLLLVLEKFNFLVLRVNPLLQEFRFVWRL